MASPPKTPNYRTGGFTSFIPLSEEVSAVSTRGQRLPGLISSRSSKSLFTLHGRRGIGRRGSITSASSDDDDERRPSEESSRKRPVLSEIDSRRMSLGPEILLTPQMRSMRLIGKTNPRYHWHQYYKTEDQLKEMKKPLRQYYERNNYLIAQYLYIDRLLDSSLPHDLIQEYNNPSANKTAPSPLSKMHPISEESPLPLPADGNSAGTENGPFTTVKRTPKNIYKLPNEGTPLLDDGERQWEYPEIKYDDDDVDSGSAVVTVAIYINLAANVILLAGKVAVTILTSSLSVLASLVDAVLDFLSTAIVWTTTKLIARQDQYAYPVGRRRLEPVGVLVFSVIMITSFFQVGLQCFQRLLSDDRSVVHLGLPAIVIMASTVLIKGFCWFWCRLVKNSSVQALAQDAATDVVFNIFSIIFPLVGFYANVWWLDALGGLLLSLYVMYNWSTTSSEHVRNLCGAAATADQRNVLLYLTMRFAKTIKHIQGLQAYHAGDKLNVEVDIVLDEDMNLRDTHDLSESLQYVLESVPTVDRAFVHADYQAPYLDLPTLFIHCTSRTLSSSLTKVLIIDFVPAMDAIGSAAAVTGLLSLAIQVADGLKRLHSFWTQVREAPTDVHIIVQDIDVLFRWISFISDNCLQQSSWIVGGPYENAAKSTLLMCLSRTNDMIDIVSDAEKEMRRGGRKRAWASFKIAWRKDKVERTLSHLDRAINLLIIMQVCRVESVDKMSLICAPMSLDLGLRPERLAAPTTLLLQNRTGPEAGSMCNSWDSRQHDSFYRRSTVSSISKKAPLGPPSHQPDSFSTTLRRPRNQAMKIKRQESSTLKFLLGSLQIETVDREVRDADHCQNSESSMTRTDFSLCLRMAQWLVQVGVYYRASQLYGKWTHTWQTFRYVDPESKIIQYCKAGDVDNVRRLFEGRLASPSDRTCLKIWDDGDDRTEDYSLLHYAAAGCHVELCKFLIEAGLGNGSVAAMSRKPILSLPCTASCDSQRLVEVFRALVVLGQYDPMERASGAYLGYTVLHDFSGTLEAFKWLLDQDEFYIDLNQEDALGYTIATREIQSHRNDAACYTEEILRRGGKPKMTTWNYSLGSWERGFRTSPAFLAKWKEFLENDLTHAAWEQKTAQTPLWGHVLDFLRVFQAKGVHFPSSDYFSRDWFAFWEEKRRTGECVARNEIIPFVPRCPPANGQSSYSSQTSSSGTGLSRAMMILQDRIDFWLELLRSVGIDVVKYCHREEELQRHGRFDFSRWVAGGERMFAEVAFRYPGNGHANIEVKDLLLPAEGWTWVWVERWTGGRLSESCQYVSDDEHQAAGNGSMPGSWIDAN